MIRSTLRFLQYWKHRDTPHAHLAETLDLVTLAARRCAYDLKHAGNSLIIRGSEGHETGEWYVERSRMWVDIFDPTDNGKHYRHALHREISQLEHRIEGYQKLLASHGIEDPHPNFPF